MVLKRNASKKATSRHITATRKLQRQLERCRVENASLRADIERYKFESRTDPLTGLPNLRSFSERLKQEMARARRHATALTLCFTDIDHFKSVNDTYGHDTGDRMLQQFSLIIKRSLRDEDFCARIGGDEFALIFPVTSRAEADVIVERLAKEVKAHLRVPISGSETARATSSFGFEEMDLKGQDDEDALKKRADQRLYEWKSRRRSTFHRI